jgi:RNA polymerase sigma factor (sigma-70 family)
MLEADAVLIEDAYEAHLGPVTRRLTAITRNPAVAEDLAHEAFLRLTREVDAGRTPDDIHAWLQRVATNLAMSRGRHLGVADRRSAELPVPEPDGHPEVEAIKAELREALVAALDELPATDRRALLLAAQGYRGPEIAALIERTPAATRTLLCRARAKLRERMTTAGFAPA